jgi:hypothetical protein
MSAVRTDDLLGLTPPSAPTPMVETPASPLVADQTLIIVGGIFIAVRLFELVHS